MSEVKRCPKCSGEMESGNVRDSKSIAVQFASSESKSRLGFSKTNFTKAYACKVCGYIELYRKLSEE